jgi:hypothetical protein
MEPAMSRRHGFLGVGACIAAFAYVAACSFPDVTFGTGADDGGGDATLTDGPGSEDVRGGGDGPVSPSDAGSVTIDASAPCGTTEKRCGVACASTFDPSHGCAQPGCEPCPGRANGSSRCLTDGGCGFDCDPPFQDCDKDPTNGCEADPTSGDPSNCGACKKTCDGGVCQLGGTCGASCLDAGTPCSGGCVDLTKDPANCGGCGVRCDAGSNQTSSCGASQCSVKCTPGYADCNHLAADGCEANTLGSTANCGVCNNACNGGPFTGSSCEDGGCLYGCQAGHNDCNGTLTDGCECAGGPVCPGRACATNADCCGGKRCLTIALLPCLGVGCSCQ